MTRKDFYIKIKSYLKKWFSKKVKPISSDRVKGIDIFHEYFRTHTILGSNNAEEYFAGIYSSKRLFITYFQNISLWIQGIRTLLISFTDDEWVQTVLRNPLYDLERGRIFFFVLSILSFFCICW